MPGRSSGWIGHGGMMMFAIFALGCGAAGSDATPAPQRARRVAQAARPRPRNVIVLVGDGWGFNHLQAASMYAYGRPDGPSFTRFPVRYAVSTYPATAEDDPCHGHGYNPARAWGDFDYVRHCFTDSAAAGTALATGGKTANGVIGKDAAGHDRTTALEVAEAAGKATGVVTSVPFSHATPAAFVAHSTLRSAYQEIAGQMISESAADVIMGAGNPWFDDEGRRRAHPGSFAYVGGEALWNGLVAGTVGGDADGDGVADRWTLLQERESFVAMAVGKAPRRVIGVAPVATTLRQARGGDGNAPPFAVPSADSVPTLAEMTRAALNVLDDDPDGLFLLVEGGAIDWASHSHQAGRMIEESIAFERAIDAVVEWVEKESDWTESLVVVTADHETGYLLGPGSDPGWAPLVDRGRGEVPGLEWHTSDHTNSLVPLFAKGEAAEAFRAWAVRRDPVRGTFLDNADVGRVILAALGRGNEPSGPPATRARTPAPPPR